MIRFDTTPFLYAHGREPRGVGQWAFEFSWSKEPYWAPGPCSFGAAKKWARNQVRNRYGSALRGDIETIKVLS